MENNEFNTQEQANTQNAEFVREPLPQFDVPLQTAPVFEQAGTESFQEVESCVDSAFGNSLAATILAWFPIGSIIAIVLGSKGLRLVQKAIEKAGRLGREPGGKNIAAKVLGLIGKISGIVMTVFWGIYMFAIMMIIMALL